MKYTKRILVVDDDLASRMLMEELLQPHFNEVIVAESGTEALDLFREGHSFELVFMDILMRDMDGLSATRAIKEIMPHVQVVAHSAILNKETIEKCSEAGINTFLSKPIKQRELENIFRDLLNIELNIG